MEEKWDKLYVGKNCNEAVACDALRENIHLLPQSSGNALDLACGMGGNAILLAKESKLTVNAWDISSVAISKNVISKVG
jgi:tellurite methyltransferase